MFISEQNGETEQTPGRCQPGAEQEEVRPEVPPWESLSQRWCLKLRDWRSPRIRMGRDEGTVKAGRRARPS